MYAEGEGKGGVPTDFAKAARLFRLAADQGLPAAQDNLSLLRRMGIRDRKEARRQAAAKKEAERKEAERQASASASAALADSTGCQCRLMGTV
jgi:TPR repeat protein